MRGCQIQSIIIIIGTGTGRQGGGLVADQDIDTSSFDYKFIGFAKNKSDTSLAKGALGDNV